ncbi:uncharacterized protein LOC143046890 [Mytilus galloprovincialis]|uniref:uncharacterized protein LOC143046890 n=1 Tax=Mytilus galloprovincialis TaxID=29158 RepID=UPI003F7C82EA
MNTAADQCGGSDVECRDDSGTDKCLCKTTHYDASGTCTTKINLNGGCNVAHTEPCADANSYCKDDSGTKCLCQDTHFEKGGACTLNIHPDFSCSATDQCVTNAECDTADTNTCVCNAGYTATPTTTPTMCISNGEVKLSTLLYIYVVPIIVSMFFLLR